jgi:hypothetical protein
VDLAEALKTALMQEARRPPFSRADTPWKWHYDGITHFIGGTQQTKKTYKKKRKKRILKNEQNFTIASCTLSSKQRDAS